MRWLLAVGASVLALSPADAYQAVGAGPASFTQPFSQPAKPVAKGNPARQALLARIDAEIARYEQAGDRAKVEELKKTRAAVENAATDEELAVWARKLDPPEAASPAPIATVEGAEAAVDPAPAESSEVPLTALGAKTVASTAQGVAATGSDSGGLTSLFDGGDRKPAAPRKQESVAAPDTPAPSAPGPGPAPFAPPVEQVVAPPVGPGREVITAREYPRPKNIPMTWRAPPNPDAERDMDKPASLPELEAIARQNGIPIDIFRQAYVEARRQNVDYRLVLAVMKQESAFKPNAKSHAGARGLMQVMPGTGRDLGVENANMLFDVKTSIYAGTKYIRQMWNMFVDKGAAIVKSFDSDEVARVKKAIAAYNAGPGNVRKAGGVPRFRETQGYVVKVLSNYYGYMREFPPAIGPKASA